MKEYKFAHLTLEVEDTMRVAISEEEDFATVLHKTLIIYCKSLHNRSAS
ncbi:hypothetical protein H7R52_18640 [Weissella confusa]|uniref:Uncharacterized protein n=1 Tax=Weissella confusa TaxID=1583 RepID=A0A923SQD6_WEICO|nr:hypothetical protein [Weissella confusa]